MNENGKCSVEHQLCRNEISYNSNTCMVRLILPLILSLIEQMTRLQMIIVIFENLFLKLSFKSKQI